MRPLPSTRTVMACGVCLTIGWLIGSASTDRLTAQPVDPKKPRCTMEMHLAGDLYMQTSGEYRACCLQTYRWAEERLAALLKSKPARPAIVMDLDETVLDNGAFQTFLYNNKLEYSDSLWEVFEKDYPQEVQLIPGAKSFIAAAERRGVTVLYLSNRLEQYRNSTLRVLSRLKLNTGRIEQRLFLKSKDSSSEKTTRREQIAAQYNVLMLLGDNLRDFNETFVAPKFGKDDGIEVHQKAIADRHRRVDEASCHWGVDWFVLPNPSYGEWEKMIGKHNPRQFLHPTAMKPKKE